MTDKEKSMFPYITSNIARYKKRIKNYLKLMSLLAGKDVSDEFLDKMSTSELMISYYDINNPLSLDHLLDFRITCQNENKPEMVEYVDFLIYCLYTKNVRPYTSKDFENEVKR